MNNKTKKPNKKRYLKFFMVTTIILSLFYLTFNISACKKEELDIDTFNVVKGDIVDSISSTGIVDTTETMNYSVLQTAEILEILKKGDTFKKGETLLRIDNSKNELYIKQAEQNLILAEQAIEIARINYQSALDANHFAIQLAETNQMAAEQSTITAYKALENANISADQAYTNAKVALENTSNISSWSIESAEDALTEARELYNIAKDDPTTTDLALAQYKNAVEAAENAYQLAIAQQQANVDTSGASLESVDAQNRASVDSAEGAYEQALLGQSSAYWNNLSSTYSAETQIELTAKNIEEAKIQVELSKINLELAKEDMDDSAAIAGFDGIVLATSFSKGEYASPGIAAITVINDDFVIKSDINETDIAKVKIGQSVELTFDAYPEMTFNGKVSEISPISKDTAGIITFEITVEPDRETKEYLKYGLSSNLIILISETRDVLYVPIQSVYEQDGKDYVDILLEDNKIEKVEVKTGNYNYDYIEIKSGLTRGDTIVLSRIEDQQAEEDGGFSFFGGSE